MSEETASVEETVSEDTSAADAVAAAVAPTETTETTTEESNFDFVLDKYRKEGRSEQEALEIQAKSYTELNSKFGAFTGAPDEYHIALSDELAEQGVEFDTDDPMIEEAMKFATEKGMNQEGFNGMLDLYAVNQLAQIEAQKEQLTEEMNTLGDKGPQRLQNLSDWASANMSEEQVEGFQEMAVSANAVKTLEQLVALTRNAPIADTGTRAASGVSSEEVKAMYFEKDEYGNRRISSDPEFRARYTKMRDAAYGTGDHNVVIG